MCWIRRFRIIFGDWDGVDQLRGYLASISTDVFNLFFQYGRGSAPLLSANYLISRTPPVAGGQPVFTGESGVKVYENPSAFPRVWSVHTLSVASDIPSITQELNAGPDALKRNAFLSEPGPALETCTAPDNLTLSYLGLQSLDIDANMGCKGMAVVSEAFFPGWAATVDGEAPPGFTRSMSLFAASLCLAGATTFKWFTTQPQYMWE